MEEVGCILNLTEVGRGDDGAWRCEQGQGEVTTVLTVASQGALQWQGENLARDTSRYSYHSEPSISSS